MKNERDFKAEERLYEDVIDKKVIFAGEYDDVALNCDGEPCNFSYNKDIFDN
ncbi:hypothetical protein ACFHWD_15835 [Clostridium sp. MT-14]|uniref:Uncharacterized protein n=1 Tax=Clostridium aromativorans TaxID=2836848 RepID=A0ABS8N573_9CLOT|nr:MULTISPECIES: hypothetical protein [Clostridium]MCC9294966.1 hypothetical protein [Clostridium aromativorans]CAB1262731.1 conserved hypothetical protein [Clostridiaceae bacterium BL-3]